MVDRQRGVVKFFNDVKGFGFIEPDTGGSDVFVHKTNLARGVMKLVERQSVDYELVHTTKGNGNKAVDVRPV